MFSWWEGSVSWSLPFLCEFIYTFLQSLTPKILIILRWCAVRSESSLKHMSNGKLSHVATSKPLRQKVSGIAREQSRANTGKLGWSGGAKVLCILHHWGVQLILAYSWARPAILVVGKGRGGMFLFLLFLHFHSCSSFFPVPLFHLLYSLFYLFSPFLWETTQNDPQGLTCR